MSLETLAYERRLARILQRVKSKRQYSSEMVEGRRIAAKRIGPDKCRRDLAIFIDHLQFYAAKASAELIDGDERAAEANLEACTGPLFWAQLLIAEINEPPGP